MNKQLELKLKDMSNEEVIQQLQSFEEIISKKELKVKSTLVDKITTLAYEYCSDRNICGALNIDYSTIPSHSYKKILLYACYTIFDDGDIQ